MFSFSESDEISNRPFAGASGLHCMRLNVCALRFTLHDIIALHARQCGFVKQTHRFEWRSYGLHLRDNFEIKGERIMRGHAAVSQI